MRVTFMLAGTLLLSLSVLRAHAAEPVGNELPVWLDIKQIEKDVPNSEPGRCFVLAWHASQWTYMERKYRRERCLVLRAPTKNDPEWLLEHVTRDPNEKDPRWLVSSYHAIGRDTGPLGRWHFNYKKFKDRPTNKDIYNALATSPTGVDWDFERGRDCVECGVSEKNWQEVLRAKPTKFFPTPKEMVPPRPPG